ncbi:hypothetical protein RHIZO_01621 [Rhizobiaceae bacterium]|nr:hypothetical protein RHIZO_01621 [Rhizobiaceae bacterium]
MNTSNEMLTLVRHAKALLASAEAALTSEGVEASKIDAARVGIAAASETLNELRAKMPA